MKFILEPGPDGEPTLWALVNGDTDQYRYTYLLSRVDLLPDARRFWPDVVARMTGTNEAALQSIIDRLSKESDSWHAIAMDLQAENQRLRMTGTTITADYATAERVAQALWDITIPRWVTMRPAELTADLREQLNDRARAVLAALTGVPHDGA